MILHIFVSFLITCIVILSLVRIITKWWNKSKAGEERNEIKKKRKKHKKKRKKESQNDNHGVLVPLNLASHLEAHFNEKMKNSNIPLLNDFFSYSKSLPVRSYMGEYIQLFNLSYYARPKDLTDMAIAITKLPIARNEVRYISAPAKSGKTSSVLPAFLHSTTLEENGGTHYFYLPFSNNNKKSFNFLSFTPSSNKKIAERQGAAFIFECVKTLLECPEDIKSYTICVDESPDLLLPQQITEAMSDYLIAKLGKDCHIWFHVDEHGQMCDRSPESKGGAFFSRGAMETLSRLPCAKVIATYTDRPKSIPAQDSSQVCRVPIALPPIDVNQVMRNVEELSIDPSKFKSEDTMRMLISLKIRLGFKIKELDVISVLHKRATKSTTESFLQDFAVAKKSPKPLERCNELCKFSFSKISIDSYDKIDDIATADLLLGMKDSDTTDRQFADVVSLQEGLITVTIERLLKTVNSKVEVYNIGSELFRNTLTSSDLLSSTPLEAAYYWTLSCASALKSMIIFDDEVVFSIKCKDLRSARLFPDTDKSNYDLSFLKPDIMYYANERNGITTHPLADLFFITKKKELVLIDITGGDDELMYSKKKKLVSWIKGEQGKVKNYKLCGIVLAPNVRKKEKTDQTDLVSLITGESAMRLLGGLRQIAMWSDESYWGDST